MSKTKFVAEAGKQEMVLSRVFDAPRTLVFRAFTDPALVAQWWGPRRLTATIDKMDARPGGSWRIVHRDDAGHEYGFHGVYHDRVAPQRLVRTFEFEGMPGHVALETATFEDVDGRTKVVAQSVFQSLEDRDGMVSTGAESGSVESWDRLDEVLERLRT